MFGLTSRAVWNTKRGMTFTDLFCCFDLLLIKMAWILDTIDISKLYGDRKKNEANKESTYCSYLKTIDKQVIKLYIEKQSCGNNFDNYSFDYCPDKVQFWKRKGLAVCIS